MTKILIFSLILSFIYGCKSNSISEQKKQQIIAQLDSIHAIDQQYSGLPPKELSDKVGFEEAWEIYYKIRDSIGLINQNKIKALFQEYGYLGYKEIGESASQRFWISIQHADNDVAFQQKMLKALKKEVAKDNAGKVEYAMLEDRVNVNLNKKQRFGTQISYNEYGQAIPKIGLIDSLNIEQIRAEYGLPTFKEYYNHMTIMHFEMNKEGLVKSGITEPKLYQ